MIKNLKISLILFLLLGMFGNVGTVFANDNGTETILANSSLDERYVISVKLPVYETFEILSEHSLHLDPDYERFAELHYNDKVKVLKEYRYAAEILMPDGVTTGWIHKDYLSTEIMNQTWLLKEERNLRTEPNTTTSTIITKIEDGSSLKVLDFDPESNYYFVQTDDGSKGWVYGFYIINNTLKDEGNNLIIYEFDKIEKVTNKITVFTPLQSTSNITAEEINRFVASKLQVVQKPSLMKDMGVAYLEAQNTTGLNAIYLMAHSALETGWGTSVIVNQKYNFYGIGAIDLDPVNKAYDFSGQRNGIVAGAFWINQYYVERAALDPGNTFSQPTLDNMRNNGAFHQFSTDEAWAVKIAYIAKEFYDFTFRNGEVLKTGIYQDGNSKYFFSADGRMQTAWQTIGGQRYYFDLSGQMKTGWLLENGKWFFFNSDGKLAVGWVSTGGKWYYTKPSDGTLQFGWQYVGGKWYYLHQTNGDMITGWKQEGSTWYYLKPNGDMAIGWAPVGGNWYFFDNSGAMKTGWVVVSGKWYYFYKDGRMAANTVIEGYRLGKDGAWIR